MDGRRLGGGWEGAQIGNEHPRSQHSEGMGSKTGGKIAKHEQPGSQHSEGMGSKTGGKMQKNEQPGSQHSEGMGSKAGDKNPENKQVENCGDLWKKVEILSRFCGDLSGFVEKCGTS